MVDKHKILYFKNAIFHDGINYTVRMGDTWSKKVNKDDVIYIAKTGEKNLHGLPRVKIVDVFTCSYKDIPPWVLEHEHDPECNHFDGLDKAMVEAYYDFLKPPYPFTLVTCIGFVMQ